MNEFISVDRSGDQSGENPQQQLRFKSRVRAFSADVSEDGATNFPVSRSHAFPDGFCLRDSAECDLVGACEGAPKPPQRVVAKVAVVVYTLSNAWVSQLQNGCSGAVDQPASLAVHAPHLRFRSKEKRIVLS